MTQEIDKTYSPKAAEDKWYPIWEKQGHFKARKGKQGKTYSIVMPPPNVTGQLHIGHALDMRTGRSRIMTGSAYHGPFLDLQILLRGVSPAFGLLPGIPDMTGIAVFGSTSGGGETHSFKIFETVQIVFPQDLVGGGIGEVFAPVNLVNHRSEIHQHSGGAFAQVDGIGIPV